MSTGVSYSDDINLIVQKLTEEVRTLGPLVSNKYQVELTPGVLELIELKLKEAVYKRRFDIQKMLQ